MGFELKQCRQISETGRQQVPNRWHQHQTERTLLKQFQILLWNLSSLSFKITDSKIGGRCRRMKTDCEIQRLKKKTFKIAVDQSLDLNGNTGREIFEERCYRILCLVIILLQARLHCFVPRGLNQAIQSAGSYLPTLPMIPFPAHILGFFLPLWYMS